MKVMKGKYTVLHCTLLYMGFPGGSLIKSLPPKQEMQFDPWVQKIPLEKGKAIHSSILAWKIPWTVCIDS